ncbi:alpha/beta fold hydrolase [Rhodococcus opacus]|uniref:alpha/beta hydrolase n=1 Tax=Rhodococcus opacus TaxID=37919 RepID=UPI001FF301C9|nr:alpha/beta hydrolase [Rhodococcus opacus]UOT02794.1 alpha/beta fold hydrolase [Rhodococcus opacus]
MSGPPCLWRNVIRQLEGERRCVALDLPLHGHTPAAPDQDFTLGALADVVAATCDALGLSKVDVVANDTGGAVAQIFAARHPDRLSSLTLTNCETHDNVPPKAFLPAVLLARAGLLARIARPLARNVSRARKLLYGSGYQNVRSLPEEVVASYVEPLLGTHTRRVGHRGRVLPDEVGLLAARPHPGSAGSRGDPGWQVVLPRRAVARTGRRIAQILGSPFLSRAQRSGSKCRMTPETSPPVMESASMRPVSGPSAMPHIP